ncbi:MAG: KH domain-containing protein [Parasporobacterium sp.]|nr:KH domain-containing protein [Parasporobacterium sp.]
MKELVEVIAKALVDNPEQVTVTQTAEEDGTVILQLNVAKEDMGKVIGKKGRIAKSIRTVVKTVAIKENKKVVVDIVE